MHHASLMFSKQVLDVEGNEVDNLDEVGCISSDVMTHELSWPTMGGSIEFSLKMSRERSM